jgi:hypothetical protein
MPQGLDASRSGPTQLDQSAARSTGWTGVALDRLAGFIHNLAHREISTIGVGP